MHRRHKTSRANRMDELLTESFGRHTNVAEPEYGAKRQNLFDLQLTLRVIVGTGSEAARADAPFYVSPYTARIMRDASSRVRGKLKVLGSRVSSARARSTKAWRS